MKKLLFSKFQNFLTNTNMRVKNEKWSIFCKLPFAVSQHAYSSKLNEKKKDFTQISNTNNSNALNLTTKAKNTSNM